MSAISLTTFNAALQFDSDKELTTVNGGSVAFTIASSGNLNGVTIISRINTPTSISFPANFEAMSGSDPWSPFALNLFVFRYFQNYDGNGNDKIYYMCKNQVALVGSGAFTTEMNTLLAYANTQGISLPSLQVQTLINNMITSKKLSGEWTKAYGIWLGAGDGMSRAFSRLNIKNPGTYTLLERGTITYNSKGWKSNGTDGYLSTQFAVDGFAGFINDFSILIALGDEAAVSTTKYAFGVKTRNAAINGGVALVARQTSSQALVYNTTFSAHLPASASAKALFHIGHGPGTATYFGRNASFASDTPETAGAVDINNPVTILGNNGATNGEAVSGFFDSAEVSYFEISRLYTAAEHNNTYNQVNTLLQSLGIWP